MADISIDISTTILCILAKGSKLSLSRLYQHLRSAEKGLNECRNGGHNGQFYPIDKKLQRLRYDID